MSAKFFWSNTTKGFYNSELHGNKIPRDAIEITEEEWKDLLDGNASGKVIAVEDGKVVTVDAPNPSNDDLRIACEKRAVFLLEETDYTQLPDVAAALVNKEQFDDYRASLRSLVVKPTPQPVWPTKPRAVWKI